MVDVYTMCRKKQMESINKWQKCEWFDDSYVLELWTSARIENGDGVMNKARKWFKRYPDVDVNKYREREAIGKLEGRFNKRMNEKVKKSGRGEAYLQANMEMSCGYDLGCGYDMGRMLFRRLGLGVWYDTRTRRRTESLLEMSSNAEFWMWCGSTQNHMHEDDSLHVLTRCTAWDSARLDFCKGWGEAGRVGLLSFDGQECDCTCFIGRKVTASRLLGRLVQESNADTNGEFRLKEVIRFLDIVYRMMCRFSKYGDLRDTRCSLIAKLVAKLM